MPVEEEQISLSVIFRINTASTHLTAKEEDLTITTDSTNSWGSLDLIIPSHNDYELLIQTLHSLIKQNRLYQMSMGRDVLLLQHHWMDSGKSMEERIRQSEWLTLCCDRLSTPLKRPTAVSLYRKYCNAASIKPEEGLTLPKAVGLLEHARKFSLHLNAKVDPCDVIWNILLQYNAKYEYASYANGNDDDSESDDSTIPTNRHSAKKKRTSSKYETITAHAFLKFLKNQQKDTRANLQQVKDLFERLNSIALSSNVAEDGVNTKKGFYNKVFSRKKITKAAFLNYILSDTNDAFDPSRGEWEEDDMSQPLCSYWINSSHDTYLCDVSPTLINDKFSVDIANCPANVKMYAIALYRGCRALDVDVWDGQFALKGQPIVKLGATKNVGANRPDSDPIVFSDILWLIRSFILSNPETLPVILFIENHCCVSNQDKMAQDASNILGQDSMLYMPKGIEGDTLPSPNEMRGKVVFKYKIGGETQSAAFDDHDDDNDINPYLIKDKDALIHEDEADIQVYGLQTVGSLISDSPHKHEKSPLELQREAEREAIKAREVSNKADQDAFAADVKANRAEEFALELLKKANMTTQQANRELEKLVETSNRMDHATTKSVNSDDESQYSSSSIEDFHLSEFGSCSEDDRSNIEDKAQRTKNESVEAKNGFFGSWFHLCNYEVRNPGDDELDDDASCDDEEDSTRQETALDNSSKIVPVQPESQVKNEELADPERKSDWIESTPEFLQHRTELKKQQETEQAQGLIAVEMKRHGLGQHTDPEGIEVEHFYSSTVDHVKVGHNEAEKKKDKAAEALSSAKEIMVKCRREFDEVDKDYKIAKERRDRATDDVENAKCDADERMNNAERSQSHRASLKQTVEVYTNKLKTAKNAAETAASEAILSDERAIAAEKLAKRGKEAKRAAVSRAKYETKLANEMSKKAASHRKSWKQAMTNYNDSHKKWESIINALEKAKHEIKDIESSPQYRSEQKDAELGNLADDEGKMRKKHKMIVEERFALEDKLHKAIRDKKISEEKKKKAEEVLEESAKQYNDQKKKAIAAREEADSAAEDVDEHASNVNEERYAAKMRQEAREKAESTLHQIEAKLAQAKRDLQDAEEITEEALKTARISQANAEKSKRGAIELKDLDFYVAKVEKKRKNLKKAEKTYKKVKEEYLIAEQKCEESRNALNKNADLYYKAKIDANLQESKATAAQSLTHNALSAYERFQKLARAADDAQDHALDSRALAAEKVAAFRHAQDYTRKKSFIQPISLGLSRITLLHSVKFRYFEKSKALPFNHMHSLSEGKILQICEAAYEKTNLSKFNRTHMTRVFPSKHSVLRSKSNNFNPVTSWSMGCQVVCMNQQSCDAFVLVNDGRFRVNGSCGYVLKPESMIERKGGVIGRRNVSDASLFSQWNIKVLSGYNLPKPKSKERKGTINPFVRVTLYDGVRTKSSNDNRIIPIVHKTETVQNNGLNPIWDEKEGANFNVDDPCSAIILFSLWDVDVGNESEGQENFIAGAAIPVSCMREGYRSIPLFDANHMRCGSHGYTMLLTHIDGKP